LSIPTIQRKRHSGLRAFPVISLLFILGWFPTFTLAQEILAASDPTNSLKSSLLLLEKDFGVRFSYNPDEIKGLKVARVNSGADLQTALKQLLQSTQLEFERVDDQYYVIKKASSKFIQLRIIDAESQTFLPFATIRQKGTSLGIVSDDTGTARIVLSSPKDAILEVIYLGFQTHEIDINTLPSKSDLSISLEPEPLDLNDFEVKEYLNAGIASDPKANSFKIIPQEMEILPGLAERDVLLSVQIISGVNSNDESASGINIRGSSRDNTLLYWNNVPIYHTAHYFGSISSFIPSSIGILDVYKNYIPVKYGGASAGLISLESRNYVDRTFKAEASLNMTHGDAFVKTPILGKKGSLMFAARRSYNDAIPTWTYNAYGEKLFGREIRDRQGIIYENEFSNNLKFSDINFQWNYEPSDRSSVKISYINADSRFEYRENDPEDRQNIEQEHEVHSYGADISWAYRLTDRQSLTASLAYSDYEMGYTYANIRNPNIESDDDVQSRSNTVNNLEARIAHTQVLAGKHKLSLGYQFNNFDINNLINTQNFLEEDNAEQIDSRSNIHAVYSDINLQASDRLEWVLSGRLTDIESLGKTVFSPQIKANYNLKNNLLLKSTYGIYHQYLSTIKETQFTISNAVEQHWLLADDEELVPLVINKQLSLGLIYNTPQWLFDLDIYRKDIDGLLARNLGFGFTQEDGFNQGTERILGLDLTLRRRWKYFKTWFSYNFQDSEVSFPELFNHTFASNLNIRNQFSLSTSYTKGNWEFSFGYNFKSGAPYTSVDNVRLDRRNNGGPPPPPGQNNDGEFRLRFSRPNSLRLDNYHRFDSSIWHRFQGKNWKGEVGLSFINIFNRRNIYDIGYLVDYNREGEISIVERRKFFLEFTPNISLRFSF